MKYFLLSILISISALVQSQELSVMTYNIRYDNPNDGENRWKLRKHDLAAQVLFYEPDVLGIQEGLHHQVGFLDSALVDYAWFGVGRDDLKTKGEYSAIFYKKEFFEVEKSGTFYLSDTPNEISVGWDAALERICTWGIFLDKRNSSSFLFLNTHFDHLGNQAQQNSAKLILNKIDDLNTDNLPVVLVGDFNMLPEEEGIQVLSSNLNDSRLANPTLVFGPEATYNGFKFEEEPTKRIDYIFTSSEYKVEKHATLTDSKGKRYYSDHFALFATLKL